MGYGRYNKTNDIGQPDRLGLNLGPPFKPESKEAVQGWLDDTGVLPDAEANRYVNVELFQEILRDAAERIFLDVRGDYYDVSEATEMHLRRQSEGSLGAYAVRISNGERHVMPTAVDRVA